MISRYKTLIYQILVYNDRVPLNSVIRESKMHYSCYDENMREMLTDATDSDSEGTLLSPEFVCSIPFVCVHNN